MESFFLQVAGLPIHPLVVHAAVVLIPTAALAVLVGIIMYRRAPRILSWAVGLIWLAAVSAVIATQSGEALAEEIGITQTHEQWGELMGPLTVASALVVTATWWVRKRHWRIPSLVGTLASAVAAPVLLVMVVLAGHSGAEATWGGTLAAPGAATNQPAEVTQSPDIPSEVSGDVMTVEAAGYTLDEIAAHSTVDDCWIAVDGVVYDVSGYDQSHPGGSARIADICGTDATDAFRGQHGNQGSPNRTLAGFDIGTLTN